MSVTVTGSLHSSHKMKLFELTESLDNPYPYTWTTVDKLLWKGKFKATDRDMSIVVFEANRYGSAPGDQWIVSFERDGEFEDTGHGDEFRIFATIKKMIFEFIKTEKPTTVLISAEKTKDAKDSRQTLYKKMISKFASELGYTFDSHQGDTGLEFALERKK